MDKKSQLYLKLTNRKNKRLFFYAVVLAFPILQFLVFYVYVNFNTLILAFQKYENASGAVGYNVTFAGLDNFKSVIDRFGVQGNFDMVWNSLLVYVVSLGVGTTLALFFSYYIYKKFFMANTFRIFLFLPQVLSGVVLSLLFKYMVTDAYITLTGSKVGLLDMPETRMWALLFFHVWSSFGANILIYSGAMSGINESVVESAQLEGAIFIILRPENATFRLYFTAKSRICCNL